MSKANPNLIFFTHKDGYYTKIVVKHKIYPSIFFKIYCNGEIDYDYNWIPLYINICKSFSEAKKICRPYHNNTLLRDIIENMKPFIKVLTQEMYQNILYV